MSDCFPAAFSVNLLIAKQALPCVCWTTRGIAPLRVSPSAGAALEVASSCMGAPVRTGNNGSSRLAELEHAISQGATGHPCA